jgi:hypothetical protein
MKNVPITSALSSSQEQVVSSSHLKNKSKANSMSETTGRSFDLFPIAIIATRSVWNSLNKKRTNYHDPTPLGINFE